MCLRERSKMTRVVRLKGRSERRMSALCYFRPVHRKEAASTRRKMNDERRRTEPPPLAKSRTVCALVPRKKLWNIKRAITRPIQKDVHHATRHDAYREEKRAMDGRTDKGRRRDARTRAETGLHSFSFAACRFNALIKSAPSRELSSQT